VGRLGAQRARWGLTLGRRDNVHRSARRRGSISWKSTLLLATALIYYVFMKLRLVVEHDSETKRWAAFFPELPGCASAGDTEDEAIRNAKEALELWFEPAPVVLPAGAKVLEVALT
jgi:predicted RNase H-like HicB family nuclease